MEETIIRPKDGVTWNVIQDLILRADRGVTKYTTTLEENNHDDFLNHLYEELLDAAQYVKKEILVRQNIQQLIETSKNCDVELGQQIRKIYAKKN